MFCKKYSQWYYCIRRKVLRFWFLFGIVWLHRLAEIFYEYCDNKKEFYTNFYSILIKGKYQGFYGFINNKITNKKHIINNSIDGFKVIDIKYDQNNAKKFIKIDLKLNNLNIITKILQKTDSVDKDFLYPLRLIFELRNDKPRLLEEIKKFPKNTIIKLENYLKIE